MTDLDTLIRQADNTIALLRDGRGGKRARERLGEMAERLGERRDELEADVSKRYDELTPERQEKYPDIFEKKYEKWVEVLTEYERVCQAIFRAVAAIEAVAPKGKVA